MVDNNMTDIIYLIFYYWKFSFKHILAQIMIQTINIYLSHDGLHYLHSHL